jgi:hypothetical protein
VARALFDIYLGAPLVTRAPSDAEVHALEERGARIFHRFHVDAIRADMDTAMAHSLVRGPKAVAEMAMQVPDRAPLTVPLLIFYSRPFTAGDSAFLARLSGGARVKPMPVRARTIVPLELHDSVIPRLVAAPGVRLVRVRLWGCGYIGEPMRSGPSSAAVRVPQN